MEYFASFKEWFQKLEQREQHLVILAGVVIAAVLIYFAAYRPVADNLDKVRSSHQSQLALHDWMKVQVAQLKKTKGSNATASKRGNRSFSVLINQTASADQIQISRSQPRGDNQYQIWLDKVKFNQLMVWLNKLQTDYGIYVHSINISKAEEGGEVRVNLTFQDGA